MKALTILIPLGLVGFLLLATTFGAAPGSEGAGETSIVAGGAAIATIPIVVVPARTTLRQAPPPTSSPPTPTPAVLPTRMATSPPQPTAEPPSQLPFRAERKNCDPAYPEERTCIPPGPPFDQGCAITSERLFKVLPPDPQHLDHDHDGIGC